MTARASSATSGGAMSAEGAALQRLPPTVARLRTCSEPTMAALSAIAAIRPAQRRAQLELARGDRGADAQAVAVLDLPNPGDAGKVHHHGGMQDPVLHLGQEVGASRDQLGLRSSLGEDLQAVFEAVRQNEIESSHRCLLGVGRALAMIHRVAMSRRRVYHVDYAPLSLYAPGRIEH